MCRANSPPGRFNTRKGISRKTSIVFFPEFYVYVNKYVYTCIRFVRRAKRKTLSAFAAIRTEAVCIMAPLLLYIHCRHCTHTHIEPYYYGPLSKGPFLLGLFLPNQWPVSLSAGSKLPNTRAHTHTHPRGGFLRRGRFMERHGVFMAVRLLFFFFPCIHTYIYFFYSFRGVDIILGLPRRRLGLAHFDRKAHKKKSHTRHARFFFFFF